MTEIFEPADFDLISRLPSVDVAQDVWAGSEPDQVNVKLIAYRLDVADQILFFLHPPIEVTRLIYQPGNHLIRPILRAQLFGPNPGGADEISPPVVVWLVLILFPLVQRWSAHQDDPLGFWGLRGRSSGRGDENG